MDFFKTAPMRFLLLVTSTWLVIVVMALVNMVVDRQELETMLVSANFFNWRKPLTLTELEAANGMLAASADKGERLQRCMNEKDKSRLAYKGRPLTGIWATAPYLHNGSVPTLYDLLLPPDSRPRSFKLGTREFDPDKVGFVTDATAAPFLTDRARLENGACECYRTVENLFAQLEL